jgi:hypothetical protein
MPDTNYEHRLTEVEERTKSCFRRIEELEKRQNNLDELVGTVKELAIREEKVEENVKEIKADVKSLTNKPAEHWNDMIKTIIGIIVAAVAGFILAKIGL